MMTVLDGRVLLIAATVAVVGAIAAGIVAIGPPSDERARKLDARRVSDLQQIAPAIDRYWKQSGRLPASLIDVTSQAAIEIRDPATGEPYEYRALDDKRYELCATFERESEDGPRYQRDEFSVHRAGRRCFTRSVRAPEQSGRS